MEQTGSHPSPWLPTRLSMPLLSSCLQLSSTLGRNPTSCDVVEPLTGSEKVVRRTQPRESSAEGLPSTPITSHATSEATPSG
eukprot:scaffold154702_cov27-Tisochrysis_lutea.AAC.4